MTDEVNSGRRLTIVPPGPAKEKSWLASSPPDLRTNSSVSSRRGVSMRWKPPWRKHAVRESTT